MRYVLGLDLGTSSLKAVLLGEDGALAASATRGYGMQSPHPGWAEQDPAHWWTACREAIRALLAETRIDGGRVAAVCAGGQMHGTVLLDRDGRLLRPAIIWADGRAAAEAAKAEAALAARDLLPRLGGGVSPGFMAATLLWCRKHEPEIWRRVATTLLPKDYLRYRLTGMLAADPSDGSGIPAIDLYTGRWSLDALDALGLPPGLLPPLVGSAMMAGVVADAAAADCGLRPGTPVLAGGSDQAMAAIGAGLLHPGSLLISISTGGQIVAPLAAPLAAPGHGLRTICHALPMDGGDHSLRKADRPRIHPDGRDDPPPDRPRINAGGGDDGPDTSGSDRPLAASPPLQPAVDPAGPSPASSDAGLCGTTAAPPPGAAVTFTGGYLALSATLGAGLSVRWLRETLYRDAAAGDAQLLAEAAGVPAGAAGLLFLPYLAGERAPILDPLAGGVLIGMRLEHGRPQLARAVLEGIACSLRHALEPLLAAGVEPERAIVAGGLARTPLMREILAAVLGRALLPLASVEQSALGAALLAALHAGFWPSLDQACAAAVRYEPAVVPRAEDIDRYQAQYERYRALYPALRESMHELRADR